MTGMGKLSAAQLLELGRLIERLSFSDATQTGLPVAWELKAVLAREPVDRFAVETALLKIDDASGRFTAHERRHLADIDRILNLPMPLDLADAEDAWADFQIKWKAFEDKTTTRGGRQPFWPAGKVA